MPEHYRVAATIFSESIPEMLVWAEEAMSQGADFPEFRLDSLRIGELLFDDGLVNKTRIKQLVTEFPGAIYTCRHQSEAPPYTGQGFVESEKNRIAILQAVADLGVGYIDIEHRLFPTDKMPLKTDPEKTLLIKSVHDFNGTPNIDQLRGLYHKISQSFGSDIIKVATTATKPEDAETIMAFIKEHAYKKGLIAIAMGELGRKTRFEGPLWRGYLTYGYVNCSGMPGDPGMPTIRELRGFYKSQTNPV